MLLKRRRGSAQRLDIIQLHETSVTLAPPLSFGSSKGHRGWPAVGAVRTIPWWHPGPAALLPELYERFVASSEIGMRSSSSPSSPSSSETPLMMV